MPAPVRTVIACCLLLPTGCLDSRDNNGPDVLIGSWELVRIAGREPTPREQYLIDFQPDGSYSMVPRCFPPASGVYQAHGRWLTLRSDDWDKGEKLDIVECSNGRLVLTSRVGASHKPLEFQKR